MEFKNYKFAFDVKADTGFIEGYASTFNNIDNVGDVIVSGAFKGCIGRRKPKMLWQHDNEEVIGVWDDCHEDGNGLFVKGRFADTAKGRDARELARIGAIGEMSIGYTINKSSFRSDGIRVLEDVELFEVSLVTFPANDMAKITRVKSAHDNERDFEDFLREAGYSRDAAKIIAAKGFKALSCQREAEAENAELVADFRKFTQLFSKKD